MDDPRASYFITIAIVEMIFFLIIGIFFAIGNAAIARRLGKSSALWAILSLIPGINIIFAYYVFYQVIYGILDRLPAMPRAEAVR